MVCIPKHVFRESDRANVLRAYWTTFIFTRIYLYAKSQTLIPLLVESSRLHTVKLKRESLTGILVQIEIEDRK